MYSMINIICFIWFGILNAYAIRLGIATQLMTGMQFLTFDGNLLYISKTVYYLFCLLEKFNKQTHTLNKMTPMKSNFLH